MEKTKLNHDRIEETSHDKTSEALKRKETKFSHFKPDNIESKIVSKQQLIPGNEFCKKVAFNLKNSFKPQIRNSLIIPKVLLNEFDDHSGGISCLKFFNYHDLLLSAGHDGKVIIYKDKPIRNFMGHSKAISSVCLNIDETMMISSSFDGFIKKWDIESGKCFYRFKHDSSIKSCELYHNMIYFSSKNGYCGAIDSRSKNIVNSHDFSDRIFSFSMNSIYWCVTKSNGSIEFFNFKNNKVERTIGSEYESCKFNHFRRCFIGEKSGKIVVFDDNLTESISFEVSNKTSNVCFDPISDEIAYGTSDGYLKYLIAEKSVKITNYKICNLEMGPRIDRSLAIGFKNGKINVY